MKIEENKRKKFVEPKFFDQYTYVVKPKYLNLRSSLHNYVGVDHSLSSFIPWGDDLVLFLEEK